MAAEIMFYLRNPMFGRVRLVDGDEVVVCGVSVSRRPKVVVSDWTDFWNNRPAAWHVGKAIIAGFDADTVTIFGDTIDRPDSVKASDWKMFWGWMRRRGRIVDPVGEDESCSIRHRND